MNTLMWYRQPAKEWKEGLPIGNGILAGMVLGDPKCERLALNHEWLWRATNRYRDIEEEHQHLAEIRRLFFAGKVLEAGTLANEKLGGLGGSAGVKNRVDPYVPAGDLWLEFGHENVRDYRRELNLETGVVKVSYIHNGRAFTREFFAHYELPVLVLRLTGPREYSLRLDRIDDPDCTLEKTPLGLTGTFIEGSSFHLAAREVVTDDETLLLLSIGVAHDGENPKAIAEDQLAKAPGDWDELRQSHLNSYGPVYQRVSLDLGESHDELPTDERLARLRAGEPDNGLLALYFNFGRYLLLSSSRPGGLPANLQGKWNEELEPPWDSDLHQDVNLQMNYWPAEVCGLAETIGPLFDHLERFVPHAREAARKLYNCDGVWFPIQTDPWGRATPESRGWDVWIGAAAWLAQHLWWRYEYSLDEDFLRKRAYPFFKEVAAFYESYLVRDPQGQLVPVPSQSPENRFVGGTEPVSLCVAATMDLELIYDLLTHAVAAAELLDVDGDKRETWQQILADIPPLQIGRHGQLQEWFEDYDEVEPSHRHISHLVGLYPGDHLTLEDEPELTRAARASLERRLAHGGGHTGWSRAWVVCCWTRLREGDLACEHLVHLITDFATDSLLDLHPPRIFQIEGNLGGSAGIAEMLLQSHRGIIRLLPALPKTWPDGEVKGLCARGGFVLNLRWTGGSLRELTIHSRCGRECVLRVPDKLAIATAEGIELNEIQEPGESLAAFPTEPGKTYSFTFHPAEGSM